MSVLDVQPRLHNEHKCVVCETQLINRRQDSKNCSNRCRTRLYRYNKEKSVLIRFRMPMKEYTNLVVALMTIGKGGGKTVNDYIKSLLHREYDHA